MTGDMEKEDLIGLTEILGWKDITTKRQKNNGTQIWELPIKFYHGGGKIKVGSFKRGYVRRMNGCYTPYQLNKCENYDHFYKEFKTHYTKDGDYKAKWTGKYNKHICRRRILIEGETDRLEYLIDYCLRNYYIGYANRLSSDQYVTKWKHEWELEQQQNKMEDMCQESFEESADNMSELQDRYDKLSDRYDNLSLAHENDHSNCEMNLKYKNKRINELKEEVTNWKNLADEWRDRHDKLDEGALSNLSVIVNNERYKII